MGNFEASNIRVQDLDHCGIIAGICDQMGLVEQIDKILGTHPQEIISPGQVVKAIGCFNVSCQFICSLLMEQNTSPTSLPSGYGFSSSLVLLAANIISFPDLPAECGI
jgi:hypothetical protein